ncbi:MAG: Fe-S cluster assembly protein SufD [SAR202 cluster bacterium]|nr:Fe-S cluster assembly protein SufD [SAR202 cluster bacterium]
MTTLTRARTGPFAADYAALKAAAWLTPARERAWERLQEAASPSERRGNERWKYTDVRPLTSVPYRLAHAGALPGLAEVKKIAPWDDAWTTLTFVDGHFAPALSTEPTGRVAAGRLATATASVQSLLEARLAKVQAIDEEYFTLLNTAFLSDGAYVHVPDNAVEERAVHLLFIASPATSPRVAHPRTLVIAGKNSQSKFVESYVSLADSDQHFSNAVTEFFLDDGAQVEHYRILAENEKSHHIGNTRVHHMANSRFNSISFAIGPAIGRNDHHALIDGPGAETNLSGLYMTTNGQHMDNNISVNHEKPHGTSRQYYKGILAGKSRAVFSGIVVVKPGADKTFADQKDLNLLLSPGAEVDTKPSLEIFADDVKCFHGATAGHVDLDTLYYMRSRGIGLEAATQMLIRGFAAEVVERIKLPALARYVEGVTEKMLPEFRLEVPK